VRRYVATAACAGALGLSSLTAAPSASADPQPAQAPPAGVYVVVLRPQPLASYDGHLRGFAATTPASGHRLRAHSASARAYAHHLLAGQDRVLAALGNPEVLYSYTAAVDGFAAHLSSGQVTRVMSMDDVVTVDKSTKAHLDSAGNVHRGRASSVSPAAHVPPRAGHGEVVAVIDSGIWPRNPSFAGVPASRAVVRRTYPGFTGGCRTGEGWGSTLCNAKVVAAQYFLEGFGRDNLAAVDYASARDGNGHGSHTAASAAGNAGVDAQIDGQDFGHISGTAPGAALAIYKACWTAPDPSEDGCTTADTLKAVDTAVGDGVDVISYSVSVTGSAADPIERAFANAAHAGVFVAASAGDGGPGAATVSHHGPSVTTVAAATSDAFRGSVVLGDGERLSGSMVSNRTISRTRLVDATDARAPGATRRRAALCYPGALSARAVSAAVVVCERGGIARVSKSETVRQAGGDAMVLVNRGPGPTDADVHAVPTVQVSSSAGRAIRSYLRSHHRDATAALKPSPASKATATGVAGFSAHGPDPAGSAAVLKPDVAAPGVGVVSAASPPADDGRLWDIASGTSMAAPQVAGLAADVMAAHPGWSTAAVKSALMTTAHPLPGAGALAQGAGEVDLRRARDPGLVYDRSPTGRLNLASVSIGDLVARRTVVRRVTNVAARTETYTARVTGLRGLVVSVSPSTLTLSPGASRTFALTVLAGRGARYERFVGGTLTWSGSLGHRVTSPVVVRPSYVGAPQDVHVAGAGGRTTVTAHAGVTGTLATAVLGPVPGRRTSLSLTPGRLTSRDPTRTVTSWSREYSVRPGTAALRFELSAAAGHDVDLYLYRHHRLVASAVSPASHEQVTLADPRPGRYAVYVDAVDVRSRATRIPAELTAWTLPRAARGTGLTADGRQTVTGGRAFSVTVGWSGLDARRRWFAELRYRHSGAVTYLTVN
jgi:Subtilase family/Fibronectin type-III domain/PA domain/Peptidase inhibitor I9